MDALRVYSSFVTVQAGLPHLAMENDGERPQPSHEGTKLEYSTPFLTEGERQALALLRKHSRRRQFGFGNTGSIVWHSMSE
jgi:hypothetical protein